MSISGEVDRNTATSVVAIASGIVTDDGHDRQPDGAQHAAHIRYVGATGSHYPLHPSG